MMNALNDLAIEALFASHLQPSEEPSADAIHTAVTETVLRLGSEGCAAVVAAEFGDHPETAVRRVTWVREQLTSVALLPL